MSRRPYGFKNGFKNAFTLVELLVVIGIIALLISILLPALNKAREQSRAVKCASNLRSIGQGLAQYVTENKGVFPAAYLYEGHKLSGDTQYPDKPTQGYVHWSSYLYGKRSVNADAFQCPSLTNGGLPPTNPQGAGPFEEGNDRDGSCPQPYYDQQAPRMAYTVNEAIMPRNKFGLNMVDSGAYRYSFVKASMVKNSAATILATEFWNDWRIVSEANYGGGDNVCKSHRPVHGFFTTGGADMGKVPDARTSGRSFSNIYRAKASDLYNSGNDVCPPKPGQASPTRLDWVGRNHGRIGSDGKLAKDRASAKTNFLYCDGHVETKTIEETLAPFQWGEKFYSLNSANVNANPHN